jgi:short-subunit dehydrogenase
VVHVDWKTVWITGGSSGIGRELARQLDGRVSHIAVSARSADKLDELARTSRSVVSYPLDVTDAEAVAGCVRDIEAAAGPIDLAVFCAGVWHMMDSKNFDLAAMRSGIEVNYMGTVNALAAVIPGMLARGRGHIAIVASIAGYRGLPRAAAYSPTKAALINLAESLRCELAPRGITVSVVNPGFVDTPLTHDNPFPMPRILSAEDAARRTLKGLERGDYEISFPFGFVTVVWLLRILPNAFFFWVMRTIVLRNRG